MEGNREEEKGERAKDIERDRQEKESKSVKRE